MTPDMVNTVEPLNRMRHALVAATVFSVIVNVLMFTGPLFMLQIYDRILPSRSMESLGVLLVLVAILFSLMAVLDAMRRQIMARFGADVCQRFKTRAYFAAPLSGAKANGADQEANLAILQRFFTSSAAIAIFDTPWVPLFYLGIAFLHPNLAALALAGTVFVVALPIFGNRIAPHLPLPAGHSPNRTDDTGLHNVRRQNAYPKWAGAYSSMMGATVTNADKRAWLISAQVAMRFFMQSTVLGMGAYLVIRQEMTAGGMIAASILLGRALAPIEATVTQWPNIRSARSAWRQLSALPANAANLMGSPDKEALRATLSLKQVTLIPPNRQHASLRLVSLELDAGQTLGVIGPAGSGKSTLAKAITGIWPIAAGQILVGGVCTKNLPTGALFKTIGYLGQEIDLPDGTIAEVISTWHSLTDDGEVIMAAQQAGLHNSIVALPYAYATPVADSGLSAGQLRLLGVARAVFCDPTILILDEPVVHLDGHGVRAIDRIVLDRKSRGKITIIISHQPRAVKLCDLLLALDAGTVAALDSKDAILRQFMPSENRAPLRPVKLGERG